MNSSEIKFLHFPNFRNLNKIEGLVKNIETKILIREQLLNAKIWLITSKVIIQVKK